MGKRDTTWRLANTEFSGKIRVPRAEAYHIIKRAELTTHPFFMTKNRSKNRAGLV